MTQQVNPPGALPSAPSYDLINIIHSVVHQYFASSTPPLSTPPAPQESQKEENEQLLQQATVEDITESITKHGSSMPDSQSTLSTIPRLHTARSSGDSAACLSKALLLVCQHIMFLNTLLGNTLLGYIEHSKGIEAIGQGWWERAGFIGGHYQHG